MWGQMKKRSHSISQSLQAKVLFFIGLIVLVTLALSSLLYINSFRANYLEAIEWRSVTLAQNINVDIQARRKLLGTSNNVLNLETAYLQIRKIYRANRDMHVSFIAVIAPDGRIATHTDRELWGQPVSDRSLLEAISSQQITTLKVADSYHTLIPVIVDANTLIGTIDIGFPQQIVEEKILKSVFISVILCILLFIVVIALVWLAFKHFVDRPINQLIDATTDIANGDLYRKIGNFPAAELSALGTSLSHMRDAIRNSINELHNKNEEIKALIACSPVALFSVDLNHRIAVWTASAEKLFSWKADEITGSAQLFTTDDEIFRFQTLCQECHSGIAHLGQEFLLTTKGGSPFHASISCAPLSDQASDIIGIMVSVEDISERVAREKANHELQEQLLQSQKMESIGRLAGGIAHDFNNMLSVIIGNSELAQRKISAQDPAACYLDGIIDAANRSAEITRQLLGFARRQTIAPQVIDLNQRMEQTLKMLQRLLGEKVQLDWAPGSEAYIINMDVSQLDQVLTNLCINARDAMPAGGHIVIRTSKVVIDELYSSNHPDFPLGHYICLSVSDDGIGMDKQTQEKIFEPFFTTKKQGKGTGLGLATVFGIVKQNNGFINVYSEPGQGTTFRVYLTEHLENVPQQIEVETEKSYSGAGETILVVEDEPVILTICRQMLELLGYRVLSATEKNAALKQAQENRQDIALLLSDVILPGINGPELSQQVSAIIPGLKTLYMSGYSASLISKHGVLDENVHFIQKPFTQRKMAEAVWKCLHQPEPEQ